MDISRYDGEVKWIPVLAAAEELGVSRQRVYQLIEGGALVSCKYCRTVLVSARSVEARVAMMEKRKEENNARRKWF